MSVLPFHLSNFAVFLKQQQTFLGLCNAIENHHILTGEDAGIATATVAKEKYISWIRLDDGDDTALLTELKGMFTNLTEIVNQHPALSLPSPTGKR